MKKEKCEIWTPGIFNGEFLILNSRREGFTFLEVMISLAIVGSLLIMLIYTLNYNLGIADRHRIITLSTTFAKDKIYEMEKTPIESKGNFSEPYSGFSYETSVTDSSFPGMSEIRVMVKKDKESIMLSELIRKKAASGHETSLH